MKIDLEVLLEILAVGAKNMLFWGILYSDMTPQFMWLRNDKKRRFLMCFATKGNLCWCTANRTYSMAKQMVCFKPHSHILTERTIPELLVLINESSSFSRWICKDIIYHNFFVLRDNQTLLKCFYPHRLGFHCTASQAVFSYLRLFPVILIDILSLLFLLSCIVFIHIFANPYHLHCY